MTVIRPPNHPYNILKNNKLSLRAKGLLMMYLSCDALSIEFTKEDVKEFCSDEIDSIDETLDELSEYGIFEKEVIYGYFGLENKSYGHTEQIKQV